MSMFPVLVLVLVHVLVRVLVRVLVHVRVHVNIYMEYLFPTCQLNADSQGSYKVVQKVQGPSKSEWMGTI
jgi:hypothetical protein